MILAFCHPISGSRIPYPSYPLKTLVGYFGVKAWRGLQRVKRSYKFFMPNSDGGWGPGSPVLQEAPPGSLVQVSQCLRVLGRMSGQQLSAPCLGDGWNQAAPILLGMQ